MLYPTLPRRAVRLALASALVLAACQARSAPPVVPDATNRAAYAVVGGDTLHLVRFAPARDSVGATVPAVLLLHGGGWTDGDPSWVYPAAAAFAEGGFEAFAVQYRLSDSTRTPIEALADVCAALRWTRLSADSLGVDSSRVALYGVSAGGHLAASTATVGCPDALPDRGGDALLLLSPAVDVEADAHFERLLRGRATPRDLSPVANIRETMPPTVLVAGDEDTVTPLTSAQRFCLGVVRRRQTCDLRIYVGLGHLLSSDLRDQEANPKPDPESRANALQYQVRFLQRLWLTPAAPAP
ncbi:MAG: alpha/beta hydrolase [Gemmatimonadaceae bacterium]|nr:alpha/beta hydrolase [Gemmatimonadaceae bacterium]MCW5826063.1 alpha/beta hydrolase [Gemmatimonadaceae bacterium]